MMNSASNLLHGTSAYLLVIHGSRDAHYQQAAHQLTALVRQQLVDGELEPFLVSTSLEFADFPLSQTIVHTAQEAHHRGFSRLVIIPLFLLPGVHVTEDIPAAVTNATKILKNTISLQTTPYLGSYLQLASLLLPQLSSFPTAQRILLSHGSRRLSANKVIKQIAQEIDAIPAYWSVAPDLTEVIKNLARKSAKNIVIIPYFLFTGGITEAIAQRVQALQIQFPHLSLQLARPLGATPDLAQFIINSMIRRENTAV